MYFQVVLYAHDCSCASGINIVICFASNHFDMLVYLCIVHNIYNEAASKFELNQSHSYIKLFSMVKVF